MNLVWVIYLLGVIGHARGTALILAIVAILGALLCIPFTCDTTNTTAAEAFVKVKKIFIAGSVGIIFFCITPSNSTRNVIIAAYAGQEVMQMEGTKEVGGKAYKALNKVLDEYLDEGADNEK